MSINTNPKNTSLSPYNVTNPLSPQKTNPHLENSVDSIRKKTLDSSPNSTSLRITKKNVPMKLFEEEFQDTNFIPYGLPKLSDD